MNSKWKGLERVTYQVSMNDSGRVDVFETALETEG